MTIENQLRLKFVLSGTVFCAVLFALIAFTPLHVFAQDAALDVAGQTAGLEKTDIATIVGRIIGVFLGLLGIVFLILIIYSGWLFMTAAGSEDRVAKAKKTMTSAIIGLIITISAYAITLFVIRTITGEGIFGNGGDISPGGGVSIEPFSGSLGSGALRDHYPARNATDVARNTKVFVTFKDAMNIESFIAGYDTAGTPLDVSDDTVTSTLNDKEIKIYQTAQGESSALTPDQVSVSFTPDLKTFVFSPPVLGSPAGGVQYTVVLVDKIEDANGARVLNDGGYIWSFTVSTELDVTPPTVKRVSPAEGGIFDRNILVQMTFSEAVDPTSASGIQGSGLNFESVQVSGTNSGLVSGEYIISNEYKTVTFQPAEPCGVNSCGETIFCLASADSMTTIIKSATPGETFPFKGIVDVNGNALDGDSDGVAGGDFTWSFTTTGDVRLGGPQILSITPDIEASNVSLDQDIVVTFDSSMMSSSLNSGNLVITTDPLHELWFKPRVEDVLSGSQAILKHGVFLESSVEQTYQYGMTVTQGIKDEYQNCFSPAEGPGKTGGSCGTTSAEPYCCNGTPQSSSCSLF